MSVQTQDRVGWRLGPAPADFELAHVRALTPEGLVDDARIVVRDGLIAEVGRGRARGATCLDGSGLLVIPGIVDPHSDALEKERAPRPNAHVPWDFALSSLEGKLVAAGVTTIFHGAAFQHQTFRGGERSVETALEVCGVIDTFASYRVDHRVLHRLDILSQEGAATLRGRLAHLPDAGPAPLVSHEDHTPGQGQYADPRYMANYMVTADGHTEDEAWSNIARLMRESQEKEDVRAANLAWLGELASAGRITLAGHDPDTAETIDGLAARGGAVAEFPTTLQAARRAREKGLVIVAGAPNLLRGSSHSGNVSAQELLAAGLLDALASDYLPSALLSAAWQAARDGLVDLVAAIGLVTSGPAAATGLTDRRGAPPGPPGGPRRRRRPRRLVAAGRGHVAVEPTVSATVSPGSAALSGAGAGADVEHGGAIAARRRRGRSPYGAPEPRISADADPSSPRCAGRSPLPPGAGGPPTTGRTCSSWSPTARTGRRRTSSTRSSRRR